MSRTFLDLLKTGTKFIGTYIMYPCDTELEIMRAAGYDFVIFDLEHEQLTFSTIMPMLRTAEACGLATVIRVPDVNEGAIKKALDIGASAVKVPGVSTAEQARDVVRFAKYPPQGNRGACPFVRGNGYGADRFGCWERANAGTAISVIIEGQEGIRNMEEIISVEGIDSVSVGNFDLSVSLGIPGQSTHPMVLNAQRDIAEMCRKYGKSCSAQIVKPEDVLLYKDMPGVSHFHTELPPAIMYRAYKELCDGVRRYCEQ